MRGWNISIYLLSPNGEELPASCFEKATYFLHESFGPKRMRQTIRRPPFTIHEKGWGEFDMQIQLTPIGAAKSGEQTLAHDLNFQQERYESTHNVTFRNPKGPLLDALRESGDVGDPAPKSNGVTSTPAPGQAKEKKVRKNQNRNVDMEKLAEALPQLGEEDLLQVVQMVHDNKTDDTYTKNDVDSELAFFHCPTGGKRANNIFPADGEFHVDLYTLPDQLIKMLWDFTSNRVNMNEIA